MCPWRRIVRPFLIFIQVATPLRAPRAFRSSSVEPATKLTATPASRHSGLASDDEISVVLPDGVTAVVSFASGSARAAPAPRSSPSAPAIQPAVFIRMVRSSLISNLGSERGGEG